MDIKRSTFKVKSNSKPSSSSRSAELLGTQTGIGFPTQSKKINRSNEIAHFSDCTTNKSLHNAIRKLNKKDPTTKKRALEELIHDINERSVEELVVILPLWTKIYLEFAYDPIHNIRELTQEVQKMLASKCKRMIAPYLKELVPVWICSQFDNYVPAANIARASFFNIFNAKTDRVKENRQIGKKVLTFMRLAIIKFTEASNFLLFLLSKQTPQICLQSPTIYYVPL
ncbi:E3 ubiquitin-protein ligase listerin-like isoform X2 [Bactrocera dorsalis]|uniref:E3 ubiquitin-protein ligase listerin n=1 Tax=Bactrocera dorsalis TaxID=27457 RepID=A0ABM3K9E4_BACDO|nr:E3 ubiquitin-protein ligase listerin-like isoform X2 [Bactrocera dorsalis]